MTKFNVAAINACTEAEGPYKRLIIWFQGCNIHCQGCCNPDFQPLVPAHLLTLDELMAHISEAKDKYDIEGVTYSGGEPTLQQNLPLLTDQIHALGLGVISFTGRCYEEVEAILGNCDVVLDGGYDVTQPETKRRLLGSANQRILPLTNRYSNILNDWFSQCDKTIEVHVGSTIIMNGDYV